MMKLLLRINYLFAVLAITYLSSCTVSMNRDILEAKIKKCEIESSFSIVTLNLELESKIINPKKYFEGLVYDISLFNKDGILLTREKDYKLSKVYLGRNKNWTKSEHGDTTEVVRTDYCSVTISLNDIYLAQDEGELVVKLGAVPDEMSQRKILCETVTTFDFDDRKDIYEASMGFKKHLIVPNIFNIYSEEKEYGIHGNFILSGRTKNMRALRDGQNPLMLTYRISLLQSKNLVTEIFDTATANSNNFKFFIPYDNLEIKQSIKCTLKVECFPLGSDRSVCEYEHQFTPVSKENCNLHWAAEQEFTFKSTAISVDTKEEGDLGFSVKYIVNSRYPQSQIIESKYESEKITVIICPVISTPAGKVLFEENSSNQYRIISDFDQKKTRTLNVSYIDLYEAGALISGNQSLIISWVVRDATGNQYKVTNKDFTVEFIMPEVYNADITVGNITVATKKYDATSSIARAFSANKGYGKPDIFWKVLVNGTIRAVVPEEDNTYTVPGEKKRNFYFLKGDYCTFCILDFDPINSDLIGNYKLPDLAQTHLFKEQSLSFGDVISCDITLESKKVN